MDILNLIVGLFMIGVGFLVKSSPDLMAGYNTMPKDKKENVDIESLSTFMRNGFSFGPVKKGYFNLDKFGNVRLLVHSDMPPFLIISGSDGKKTIINYKDTIETKKIYGKVKYFMDNRQ